MNLENLGLVELNAQEVQEVDGGLFGLGPWLFGAGRFNVLGNYNFGGYEYGSC
jgi:hypothetical protein